MESLALVGDYFLQFTSFLCSYFSCNEVISGESRNLIGACVTYQFEEQHSIPLNIVLL